MRLAGDLVLKVQERSYRSPDGGRLLRHLPGKLLVIWDGAPILRGQLVKDVLAADGARRTHLEYLPGYAPDPNNVILSVSEGPDEGMWN